MPDEGVNDEASLSPDTPSQARVRAEFEAELRSQYGDEWMEKFKGLLDVQWEMIKGRLLVTTQPI